MRRILIWLLVAVVILIGVLAFWIYPPMSERSSRLIAAELFKYRSQFANDNYLSIGLTSVLPDALWELCPKDHSPSCHTDMNSASMIYSDTQLGIYYERWFEVKRSSTNDTAWTFTRAGRTWLPIKGWVYFDRSITVSNTIPTS